MENNQDKRRVIAPNFGKHPELALQLLEDEKTHEMIFEKNTRKMKILNCLNM